MVNMQFSEDETENQKQWSICSFQRMKQRIRSLQQQWPRKTAACPHSPGQLAPAVLCGWLPHCRMPANTNVLSCKRVLICKVLTANVSPKGTMQKQHGQHKSQGHSLPPQLIQNQAPMHHIIVRVINFILIVISHEKMPILSCV